MQGNSATIAFGTSAFTANMHLIGIGSQSREAVETSHLATDTDMEFEPADLKDAGQIEIEFEFDPDSQPPIDAAPETVTITFPVPSGSTNGATLAGTAFVTEWTPGELRNNTLLTGTATIKWDGKTGPAWTDAS